MKTNKEIEILLYNYIKSSELVNRVSGTLSHVGRPTNSKLEDIVVSCKSGTSGQFQSFVCDVNIYVPNINADGESLQDSSRVTELMRLCVPLFNKFVSNEFRIEYDETPNAILIKEVNEYCINNRIVLTCLNLE